MNAIMMLHRAQAGYLAAQGSGSKYIKFADPAVEAVLLAKGVSSDGVGITTADVEKVTSIGTWFKGNTEITSFDEFERFNGVTELGSLADSNAGSPFYGCTSLKTIILPSSVTHIRTQSFMGCASLESVNLVNENITYIANETFKNCSNLRGEINLPNLETMGGRVSASNFQGTGIERVTSLGKITKLWGHYGANYGEFLNCKNLSSVVLPETLESIGGAVFQGCTALVEINLPSSLNEVNERAFYGCTSLAIDDLALPNLTSLGQNAFYGVKIKKISDLGKLESLPYNAFYNNTYLEEVNIPCVISDAPNTSNGAFRGCTSLQTVNFTNDDITKIGAHSFGNCTSLEALMFPSATTYIGMYAFSGDTKLTTIVNWNEIAEQITTIRGYAFYNCPLEIGEDLVLPKLQTLGGHNFNKSGIIRVLDLGSITTLPRSDGGLFSSSKTELIVLPSTVTEIASFALYAQNALRTLVCKAATPPSLGSGNSKLSNCTIYVPDASVADYQAATNWATHSARIKGINSLQTDNPTLYNEIKDYL